MISFFRKTPPQQELSAQEMYTIAVANAQRVIREEFSNPVLETVTMDRQVTTHQIIKESLNIIAPVKDFDMKKSKLNGNMIVDKIEVPDPIVLNPVCYKNRKYSLVVTAWGLEASDELVVNPNHN